MASKKYSYGVEEEEDDPIMESIIDPLWEEYKIKPSMSISKKVNILFIRYRKTEEEILEILGTIDRSKVRAAIKSLETDLRNTGKILNDSDKELARGRMIRQYQDSIQEIEEMLAIAPDPRLLTSKIAAQKELKELQGLGIDKKEVANEESDKDLFEKAINDLTPDQLEKLYRVLGAY